MRCLLLLCLLAQCFNAVSQQKDFSTMITEGLQKRLSSAAVSDSVDVVVATDRAKNFEVSGRILQSYASAGVFVVRMPAGSLKSQRMKFIDVALVPKEELTTASLDLATNFVNLVHRKYPGITGENILISFKENRFDTTDIDLIGRYRNTYLASPNVTAHATIMATTAAGAGNTSPFGKGAAPRAFITSSDFSRILPDPDTSYTLHGISIQNHSYGTAIQNFYGAEAMAYDVNANIHPHLLHVFSSGNSGAVTTTTGTYAGIPGMANLTGNFKYSKNTISVGAIDSFYRVAALSSKGPAPDGRIKPELVAFGQDGSSGAAAMVSGTAALLQHAYKTQHGSLPPSSLLKAVLLNSAKDVEAPGIDFSSGYGALNVFDAVKTVVEGRIIVDSLVSMQAKTFPLSVPANASLVKVTVAWNDPAAAVNATKTLVHDLDITLSNSTGSSWQPWVLSSKAHADSLKLPAVRKRDTLNNVEFVSVTSPVAGNYIIEVKAPSLSTARQVFSVAYQIDTINHFLWTYPTADDPLEAGTKRIVRWQTNRQESATIEYSLNGGNWLNIGSLSNASLGFFEWNVPDSFATANLRLRFTGNDYVSDSFVISRPIAVETGFNCTDSFLLYWNRTPATQYQVYHMVGNYLQPAIAVADTFRIFNTVQFPSDYFAIAPIIGGKPGLRGNSANYRGNGVACYFKSFYLKFTLGKEAHLFASLGSLYHVQSVSLMKYIDGSFKVITSVVAPQTTDFNFVDPDLIRGQNNYLLRITLFTGQVVFSDPVVAYYFGDEDVIVYPNPVSRGVPFRLLSNKAGRHVLSMYTSSGMKVLEMKVKDLTQHISTQGLSAGMYFMHVTDDEGKKTIVKVVIR